MTAPPETLPSRARAGFNDSVHGLVLSFTTNPGIIPLLKHEISGTVQWLPVLRRDCFGIPGPPREVEEAKKKSSY